MDAMTVAELNEKLAARVRGEHCHLPYRDYNALNKISEEFGLSSEPTRADGGNRQNVFVTLRQ